VSVKQPGMKARSRKSYVATVERLNEKADKQ
jgi:hypothetical protein